MTITVLDFIDARGDFLERQHATPPAPSFSHYEKLEHGKTPPPGIPFGYIIEVKTCTCNNCGRKQQTSKMFQVARAGYGSAMLGLGSASPIFDRPIKRVDRTEATPRCIFCIEDLRPEPVHYPVPGAAVGRSRQMAEANGATTSPKPVIKIAASTVADDFQ